MPRKPVRGRYFVVVPLHGGGSFKSETVPEASRSPEQLVGDLRDLADFIEKHFTRKDRHVEP